MVQDVLHLLEVFYMVILLFQALTFQKKTIIKYDRDSTHVFVAAQETDGNYIDGSNPKNHITCTTSGGCFSIHSSR